MERFRAEIAEVVSSCYHNKLQRIDDTLQMQAQMGVMKQQMLKIAPAAPQPCDKCKQLAGALCVRCMEAF